MKRAARMTAAFLLAGLLLMIPGVGSFSANAWEFRTSKDKITDEVRGFSFDRKDNGAVISFQCKPDKPAEDFIARVSTNQFDIVIEDNVEVAWRIDNETAQTGIWFSGGSNVRGSFTLGKAAIDFAIAASRARQRIVFRSSNGTVEFDASGSTQAVTQLLEFCGIAG